MGKLTKSLPQVELAIMGGSGFPRLIGAKVIRKISPDELNGLFGKPSGPVYIIKFQGKMIAFMCRHGEGHEFNPTFVNYRANVWALVMLGVKKCFGISACGSLTKEIKPGILTIPHQLFDNTKLRQRTFFEIAAHVSLAQPFCQMARSELIAAIKQTRLQFCDHAKYITIEGPSYSTEAESEDFIFRGFHIVGMTTSPEAHLMREAGICYAVITMPTDYDAGLGEYEAVNAEMVERVFRLNVKKVRKVLRKLIFSATTNWCSCHNSLENAIQTNEKYIYSRQHYILRFLRRTI